LAFIERHHLVAFRLHDEIHVDATDHNLKGMYEALGWNEFPHPGPRAIFCKDSSRDIRGAVQIAAG
jgi:hypothetical protein